MIRFWRRRRQSQEHSPTLADHLVTGAAIQREFGREKWARVEPMLRHLATERLAIDEETLRAVKAAEKKKQLLMSETRSRLRLLSLTEEQQAIIDRLIEKTILKQA